jgi:hypothetical protein
MEEYDKTYMWMTAVSFIALLVAIAFGVAEINELKSQEVVAAPTANAPSAAPAPAPAAPAPAAH